MSDFDQNASYQTPSAPGGQEHPKGVVILILGIVSIVCCVICGPIAWVMGNTADREIKEGLYAPTTLVTVGKVLGIIGTVFLAISVLISLFSIIFGFGLPFLGALSGR